MRKKSKAQSPARQLLQLVWDHNREATGWSWNRLNHSMQDALTLALNAGMHFDSGDFAAMYTDFRGHHWFITNDDHSQGETFYRLACHTGNTSACQSFEDWKQRPPYVCRGQRLHIGAVIEWQDRACVVTSFAKDGSHITACAYKNRPTVYNGRTYYSGKILKRYTITLADLRAAERSRRAEQKKKKKAAGGHRC